MKVYYLAADTTGCGQYRASLPAGGIRASGLGQALVSFERVPQPCIVSQVCADIEKQAPTVVVFQRQFNPVVLELLRVLKRMGTKVIYELDDDMWSLPEEHPRYAEEQTRLAGYDAFIGECHAVIVSTVELAKVVAARQTAARRGLSPNRPWRPIFVWPNVMNHMIMVEVNEPPIGYRTIGWAGSPSHEQDLAVALPALATFMKKNPKAEVEFFGYMPPAAAELPGAALRVRKLPWQPFGRYYNTLVNARWSFGIVPLTNHPFNRSKSCLKVLEYGLCGIPALVSPVGETGSAATAGCALAAKRNRYLGWLNGLQAMWDDPRQRMRVLTKCQNAIRSERSIASWVIPLVQFFEEVKTDAA